MELFFIILALLAVAIAFFYLRGSKSNSKKANKVFIIGPQSSGKTSLLYYLANRNNDVQTTNSIESMEAIVELQGRQIQLVDVPGHQYAKQQFLNRLTEAQKIILVVDSSSINSIPHVADILYDLVTQSLFQRKRPPVLLWLNKQDQQNAFKINDFEMFLSREIEKIKKSRKAIHEQKVGVNDTLKFNESTFTLEEFSNIKVSSGSVKNQEIDDIEKFIVL